MNEWQAQYMQQWPLPTDPRLDRAKPCPFCGSRNLSISQRSNYVHCETCEGDGPVVEHYPSRDAWIFAINRWNERA